MMSDPADQLGAYRKLKQDHEQLQRENAALKAGGGGGTSPPMADDNQGLGKRVDGLQTLVYGLLALIAASFLGIIGTFVTFSNGTNGRIDKAIESVSGLNREVGQVGTKVDEVNKRLDRMDQKLDRINDKLDKR